jgi:hypothetical protein
MNNRFDELTKSMAQSVTRRAAVKEFGVGLAGMALACFGHGEPCGTKCNSDCEAMINRGLRGRARMQQEQLPSIRVIRGWTRKQQTRTKRKV